MTPVFPNHEGIACPGLRIYPIPIYLNQADVIRFQGKEQETFIVQIAGWPLVYEIVSVTLSVVVLCNQHLHRDVASYRRERIQVPNRFDEGINGKLDSERVERARALQNG
jgi:hypothetical protein